MKKLHKNKLSFLYGVDAIINILEYNVISNTIEVPFSAEDMLNWLYPKEQLELLRKAFDHVREIDRGYVQTEHVVMSGLAFSLTLYMNKMKILCPVNAVIIPECPDEYKRVFVQIAYEHAQFNKVRRVVEWLKNHATPGAMRHFCPWLSGLLPSDHKFHQLNGEHYLSPAEPMREIIPAMRECGAIVASALLCPSAQPNNSLITITLDGSQQFPLVSV